MGVHMMTNRGVTWAVRVLTTAMSVVATDASADMDLSGESRRDPRACGPPEGGTGTYRSLSSKAAALALAAAAAISAVADASRAAAATPSLTPPPARIRNGTGTFGFPAVGALAAALGPEDTAFCTATLIGCHTVLTAGHCVCLNGAENCAPDDQVPAEHIVVFFQHGGASLASAVAVGGIDLAVVTLEEPITGIIPAPVNSMERPGLGAAATIVGFGTDGGFVATIPQGLGIKRTASVRLTSCQDVLADQQYLCIGVPGQHDAGICPGDSGGPLLVDLGAGPVLAGVASFARGGAGVSECMPPLTEFFTDVLPWQSFIETAGGADLSDEPCGDLPAVGTPGVTVYTFAGTLTPTAQEVRGDFDVPPGIAELRVTMNGVLVTGQQPNDFDLFVEQDAGPTNPICSYTKGGAFGVCEVASPGSGSWHVRAHRVTGQGDVQLTATLFGGPSIADCVGDCDASGNVTIAELVRLVDIALGSLPVSDCPTLGSLQGGVTIDVLIRAVNAAADGCAAG
jgi:hypothetical protein